VEAYYQETGRAGRDGLPASAFMLYGLQDAARRRQMINDGQSPPEQKRVEHVKLNALLGYCEAATCRRRVLLNYFGDEQAPCGNCDTCQSPPESIDGTIAAQKILSTVYRTNQLFGAKHIIDVLMGVTTPQTEKHRHARLSTWAIGADRGRKEWDSFIRQMVAGNLLAVDLEGHGGLYITPEGSAFLKSKDAISFRLPAVKDPVREARTAARSKLSPADTLDNDADRALFDRLKALRLSIARDHNLPPYVIFHDKTLLALAARRPLSLDSMAQIPGIGQSKLDRYGPVFLAAIDAG
jgi:ATP-dependent DNA helicase RecQ